MLPEVRPDAALQPRRWPDLRRALGRIDPPPDVFTVVMATTVVSIAAVEHHYQWISGILGLVAVVAFVLLGSGFVVRVSTQPRRVLGWTRGPDEVLRMFTFVAACAVLAARWPNDSPLGWVFDTLALCGWLVLIPLGGLNVHARRAAQLREGAHGAWLLPSVATQGLAINAAILAAHHHLSGLALFAGAAWLLGLLVYLAVLGLILWRVLSGPLMPDTVTPDSWILMGALAITALAGGHLLGAVRALRASAEAVSVATAMAFWPWVLATLWIPILLYAQVWRADHLPGSLRYEAVWWSAVFPIGMYSVASSFIATLLAIPALRTVSLVFFWNGLALWMVVAIGLVHAGLHRAAVLIRGRAH